MCLDNLQTQEKICQSAFKNPPHNFLLFAGPATNPLTGLVGFKSKKSRINEHFWVWYPVGENGIENSKNEMPILSRLCVEIMSGRIFCCIACWWFLFSRDPGGVWKNIIYKIIPAMTLNDKSCAVIGYAKLLHFSYLSVGGSVCMQNRGFFLLRCLWSGVFLIYLQKIHIRPHLH